MHSSKNVKCILALALSVANKNTQNMTRTFDLVLLLCIAFKNR